MSDALHRQVQETIRETVGGATDLWEWPDADFEGLARALFAHQYEGCAPYRHYCDVRGVDPGRLPSWEAIPSVPTEVFKSLDLCCFPVEEAAATFKTSGTTLGARGAHHLRRTDTYAASLGAWLDFMLLPDGLKPSVQVLGPAYDSDPSSSLSFMLQWALEQRGDPASRFWWGPDGPDVGGLQAELQRAEQAGVPILLLGTARAFEALWEEGLRGARPLRLPTGSRLMETGGFKGAEQRMEAEALRSALAESLSLPAESVVSEYGMTELGSQGYHAGLRLRVDAGSRLRFEGLEEPERLFVFPPWCRVRAVDPDSLQVLPLGQRGLLAFWDLSNIDSVLAVQTADEGTVHRQGVRLHGRAPGASPRGCSLAVDEILRGVGP